MTAMVRSVVETMPPTMGAAIRFITSAPVPALHRIGARPAVIAATVMTTGRSRSIAIEKLHMPPSEDPRSETVLDPDEILTEVVLPPPAPRLRSSYRKVRTRGAWDFALAGVALAIVFDGGFGALEDSFEVVHSPELGECPHGCESYAAVAVGGEGGNGLGGGLGLELTQAVQRGEADHASGVFQRGGHSLGGRGQGRCGEGFEQGFAQGGGLRVGLVGAIIAGVKNFGDGFWGLGGRGAENASQRAGGGLGLGCGG